MPSRTPLRRAKDFRVNIGDEATITEGHTIPGSAGDHRPAAPGGLVGARSRTHSRSRCPQVGSARPGESAGQRATGRRARDRGQKVRCRAGPAGGRRRGSVTAPGRPRIADRGLGRPARPGRGQWARGGAGGCVRPGWRPGVRPRGTRERPGSGPRTPLATRPGPGSVREVRILTLARPEKDSGSSRSRRMAGGTAFWGRPAPNGPRPRRLDECLATDRPGLILVLRCRVGGSKRHQFPRYQGF